jgi:transcriptional regulator with XRE-family HTH domain
MTQTGFQGLQQRLLERLRLLIRNGEWTERRLARTVGLSQPHIHNLMKGTRQLTPAICDLLMLHLNIGIQDLVTLSKVEAELQGQVAYVPLVEGRLGPSWPWPTELSSMRHRVEARLLCGMQSPVVAVAGRDPRMEPLFSHDDHALLDQSLHARTHIDEGGLYLLKRNGRGIFRRLRRSGKDLYIVSADCEHRCSAWERVVLGDVPLALVVRAKAVLLTGENWK